MGIFCYWLWWNDWVPQARLWEALGRVHKREGYARSLFLFCGCAITCVCITLFIPYALWNVEVLVPDPPYSSTQEAESDNVGGGMFFCLAHRAPHWTKWTKYFAQPSCTSWKSLYLLEAQWQKCYKLALYVCGSKLPYTMEWLCLRNFVSVLL